MAKIKKLKENGATIYPATIPQAVVDPVDNTTLSEIVEDLALTFGDMNETKNILQAMSDLRSTVNEHSNSGLKGYAQYINLFIEKVNSFLEDADASDTTINRWKEIESFLAGITDTETLTGLLADNLTSAKSYTDSKVSSATANAVTMGSNAGAADRVMVSAGANKTAKDSGVALSSLARTTTATSSANGLMSSADKAKLDGIVPSTLAKTDMSNVSLQTLTSKGLAGIREHEYTLSGDTLQNLNGFMSGISVGDGLLHIAKNEYGYAPISVVEDPTTGSVACIFVASNRRLYYIYADDDTGSWVYTSNFIASAATTSVSGLMSASDKAKLNGIATNANNYSLPVASSSALGGVKSGGNITVGSDGAVTVNQATKATQDSAGANITSTYLKASAVTDVTDYKEITL